MIQKILLWSYVFLGIGAFCYWISALLSFFRMLKHRKKDRSVLAVATTGMFSEDNFTEQGAGHRRDLFSATIKFCLVIAAMYIVVLIGIQTQG